MNESNRRQRHSLPLRCNDKAIQQIKIHIDKLSRADGYKKSLTYNLSCLDHLLQNCRFDRFTILYLKDSGSLETLSRIYEDWKSYTNILLPSEASQIDLDGINNCLEIISKILLKVETPEFQNDYENSSENFAWNLLESNSSSKEETFIRSSFVIESSSISSKPKITASSVPISPRPPFKVSTAANPQATQILDTSSQQSSASSNNTATSTVSPPSNSVKSKLKIFSKNQQQQQPLFPTKVSTGSNRSLYNFGYGIGIPNPPPPPRPTNNIRVSISTTSTSIDDLNTKYFASESSGDDATVGNGGEDALSYFTEGGDQNSLGKGLKSRSDQGGVDGVEVEKRHSHKTSYTKNESSVSPSNSSISTGIQLDGEASIANTKKPYKSPYSFAPPNISTSFRQNNKPLENNQNNNDAKKSTMMSPSQSSHPKGNGVKSSSVVTSHTSLRSQSSPAGVSSARDSPRGGKTAEASVTSAIRRKSLNILPTTPTPTTPGSKGSLTDRWRSFSESDPPLTPLAESQPKDPSKGNSISQTKLTTPKKIATVTTTGTGASHVKENSALISLAVNTQSERKQPINTPKSSRAGEMKRRFSFASPSSTSLYGESGPDSLTPSLKLIRMKEYSKSAYSPISVTSSTSKTDLNSSFKSNNTSPLQEVNSSIVVSSTPLKSRFRRSGEDKDGENARSKFLRRSSALRSTVISNHRKGQTNNKKVVDTTVLSNIALNHSSGEINEIGLTDNPLVFKANGGSNGHLATLDAVANKVESGGYPVNSEESEALITPISSHPKPLAESAQEPKSEERKAPKAKVAPVVTSAPVTPTRSREKVKVDIASPLSLNLTRRSNQCAMKIPSKPIPLLLPPPPPPLNVPRLNRSVSTSDVKKSKLAEPSTSVNSDTKSTIRGGSFYVPKVESAATTQAIVKQPIVKAIRGGGASGSPNNAVAPPIPIPESPLSSTIPHVNSADGLDNSSFTFIANDPLSRPLILPMSSSRSFQPLIRKSVRGGGGSGKHSNNNETTVVAKS